VKATDAATESTEEAQEPSPVGGHGERDNCGLGHSREIMSRWVGDLDHDGDDDGEDDGEDEDCTFTSAPGRRLGCCLLRFSWVPC
jgi:hypothetical protein